MDVVKGATGGKGVDLIVDMVGQAHFTRNLDALAMDGRMTLLSMISGSFFLYFVCYASGLTVYSLRPRGLKS